MPQQSMKVNRNRVRLIGANRRNSGTPPLRFIKNEKIKDASVGKVSKVYDSICFIKQFLL